jgi:acetyl-CoA acetyltransferase
VKDIAIVGVGESSPACVDNRPFMTMVMEAVEAALADAGLQPSDINGFVSESALMPRMAPANSIVAALGISPRQDFHVQYGLPYGAGLVASPELAAAALHGGRARAVLCWFGQQLSRYAHGPRETYAEDPNKVELEMPQGWFGQPVYFAGMAQRYAHEYGLTAEQLAAVAMEAREHAQRTPGALRTTPMTFEDYRRSPMIASPLRAADCCLVTDGAVAFIMTTTEHAQDLRQKPVVVAGVGTGRASVDGELMFTQNPEYLTTPAVASGPKAFEAAHLRPSDVDFVELYDCFTINTILQYEDLGFVAKGEGAVYALEKGRLLTDVLPTNTHGGLLSHSYTLGGGHVVEAVRQLRHQRGAAQVPDAQVGLVTALGVPYHSSLILRAAT